MAEYTVSQEAMARGAARVDDAANELHRTVARLRSDVDAMLGGWSGEAATSFVAVHQAFEEQAARITGALRRMHAALASTQRTYAAQESAQARSLTALARRINGAVGAVSGRG